MEDNMEKNFDPLAGAKLLGDVMDNDDGEFISRCLNVTGVSAAISSIIMSHELFCSEKAIDNWLSPEERLTILQKVITTAFALGTSVGKQETLSKEELKVLDNLWGNDGSN